MSEEEKQKVIEVINKRKPEVRAWLDRNVWKDFEVIQVLDTNLGTLTKKMAVVQ